MNEVPQLADVLGQIHHDLGGCKVAPYLAGRLEALGLPPQTKLDLLQSMEQANRELVLEMWGAYAAMVTRYKKFAINQQKEIPRITEHHAVQFRKIVELRGQSTLNAVVAFLRLNEKIIDASTLKKISLLDGDPHNSGSTPLLLECDNGQKSVVKKIDPGTQIFFEFLVRDIYLFSEAKPPSLAINFSAAKSGWLIRDFVEVKNRGLIKDAKEYYFHLGALLAVTSLCRASDLHFENIVCHKPFPMPVDVEFLFAPKEQKRFKNPFYRTGLVGSALAGASDMTEFSKIGIHWGSGDMLGFQKSHQHSDHVLFDKNTNLPFSVGIFRQELLDGFRWAGEKIASHRFRYFDMAHELFVENKKPLRILMRNTAVYKIIQLGAWAAIWKKKAPHVNLEYAEKLRSRLTLMFRRLSPPQLLAVIDIEVMDLADGDIPYFSRVGNSTSLHHFSGKSVDGFFRLTLSHELFATFRGWNSKNVERLTADLKATLERS